MKKKKGKEGQCRGDKKCVNPTKNGICAHHLVIERSNKCKS